MPDPAPQIKFPVSVQKPLAASAAAGATADARSPSGATSPAKATLIRRLQRPVAIAMWDFSWLLRRHPNGGFEDWERSLDELAERGYNAVRMDVFPHLVGRSQAGHASNRFTYRGCAPGRHALWGNDVEVTVNPREALLEFIPLCRQRNITVALSTWFLSSADNLPPIEGMEGFIEVWESTIDFMAGNRLLENTLFIDLLNEYPLWHGFNWLREQAARAANAAKTALTAAGQEFMQVDKPGVISDAERTFYRQGCTRLLTHFRQRYPQYDFTTSITANTDAFHPERCVDIAAMDVLDAHIWFGQIPYLHRLKMGDVQDLSPEQILKLYGELKQLWNENRQELIRWMDEQMGGYALMARAHQAVLGNTEGWGSIGWDDIPPLDWEFIKESADLCVDLALKHHYQFICTSNFTHPHFKRLWADVGWHQRITSKIKKQEPPSQESIA